MTTDDHMRRIQIIDGMVAVVYEQGFALASVTAVCARAKVSRWTFYETFESREACFLAVLDQGHARARALISGAFEQACEQKEGLDAALAGLRGALVALLSFFDAEPRLARVWLVESLAVGSGALRRRECHVESLTEMIVDYWNQYSGVRSPSLAAAGVMASVLGLIQTHLILDRGEPLITLLGPLMGVVTAPYLDAKSCERETVIAQALADRLLATPERGVRSSSDPNVATLPDVLGNPRANRVRECLLHLAEHPSASNREVARAIGVVSHTQISTLLGRLERMGLLTKRAGRPGGPNAWSLTAEGERAARALGLSPALDGASTPDVRTSHTGQTVPEFTVTP